MRGKVQLLIKIFQLLSESAKCDNENSNQTYLPQWSIIHRVKNHLFLLSWRANSWVAREMSAKRYKWRELFLFKIHIEFQIRFWGELQRSFHFLECECQFLLKRGSRNELRIKILLGSHIVLWLKPALNIFLLFLAVTLRPNFAWQWFISRDKRQPLKCNWKLLWPWMWVSRKKWRNEKLSRFYLIFSAFIFNGNQKFKNLRKSLRLIKYVKTYQKN